MLNKILMIEWTLCCLMSMPWPLGVWEDMLEGEIPADCWAMRQIDERAKNSISHSSAPTNLYKHNHGSKPLFFLGQNIPIYLQNDLPLLVHCTIWNCSWQGSSLVPQALGVTFVASPDLVYKPTITPIPREFKTSDWQTVLHHYWPLEDLWNSWVS